MSAAEANADHGGLTFSDFLERMKDPQAADLVRSIKNFIRHFEERPSGTAVDPEADASSMQAFLSQSEQLFRQHPVWRGCQPEVLDQAIEGLEKYVMSKVWRQTFGTWQEDRERDERYQRLMQALGFVDLPTLMGANVQPDESLLALAQGEVLKMDRYKAPRDKLLCLVNVKTMVESIVGLAAKAGANIGGADAFFPVFLFIVIRSRLPRLASNVEYIKRFRMRSRLHGQFDYMLCNLESAAMYLDTVNYEHLAVSQEQFLAHLAAAGIPEAHLELHRMQQEAAAAAAAAEQAQQQRAAEQAASTGSAAAVAASAAAADVAKAAAAGAAKAAARQEQQQVVDAADTADVLVGLQLAYSSAGEGGNGSVGLESAQTSIPATPVGSMALPLDVGMAQEDSLPSLTPLGAATQSPPLLEPAAVADAAAAADSSPADTGAGDEQQQHLGSTAPRELTFEAASEPVVATAAAAAVAAQQQEQSRQQQAAQAAAAAAVAAAAWQQPYAEAALIEEMVAEGTRHVLAAEAAGQLQQRYPFMYAQAEDLSLAEVEAVLVGYKELLLRYEALSRTLQQQLGLGGGTDGTDGSSASGSMPAAAAAPANASPGHRSKGQQQQAGFGSMIIQGAEQSMGAARRALSNPILVAAPGGRTSPAAGSAASSADASPSGKWSPGGILQRIASRGGRRSQTPPKDRDGERAAAADAAAQAVAADAATQGVEQGAAGVRAASPARQGQHPFFSTLFGSPRQQQQQQEQQGGQPAAAPEQHHAVASAAAGHGDADVDADLQQAAATSGVAAGPELSFADELLQPQASGRCGGAAAGEGLSGQEQPQGQPGEQPAASSGDLIQLDASASEEVPGVSGGSATLLPATDGGPAAAGQGPAAEQQGQPLDESLI